MEPCTPGSPGTLVWHSGLAALAPFEADGKSQATLLPCETRSNGRMKGGPATSSSPVILCAPTPVFGAIRCSFWLVTGGEAEGECAVQRCVQY